MTLRAMVLLTDKTPPECLSWRTAWLLKGKEQCPFSTSMGVAKQLPIAVFLRHAAVANPDRRYSFPSHSLTSYQIFCRNPAVSPWYHHPCSTSYASFYRCCFLWYKLRNGTISVFSRPSDKSLLFSLLMTSINLEYTRTHHLEGRRWHIYFQRERKTVIVAGPQAYTGGRTLGLWMFRMFHLQNT